LLKAIPLLSNPKGRLLEATRKKVAREAATLLYNGLAQEYKQAKEKAAKNLGVRIIPSNLEVAVELDKIADEIEGPSRKELIAKLRKLALQTMTALSEFSPKLIGSVWRGTCYKGSDIDILIFSTDAEAVLKKLKAGGFNITKTEWRKKAEKVSVKSYFHIYLRLPAGNEVEVVMRSPDDLHAQEKCDIYGDTVTGLSISQLQELLEKDPLKKFMPK